MQFPRLQITYKFQYLYDLISHIFVARKIRLFRLIVLRQDYHICHNSRSILIQRINTACSIRMCILLKYRCINSSEKTQNLTLSELCPTLQTFILAFILPCNSLLEDFAFDYAVCLFVSSCVMPFWRVRIIGKASIRLDLSVCPSFCHPGCPLGTTNIPQDGFTWKLIHEYFSKICWEDSSIIIIAQQ